MSVNIVPTQQPSTFWQRLTGTEPKTVVKETSTTTISSTPGGSFDVKTALRNAGIGAGIAGVLGGVSLLGKVALPIVGKIGTVAGLAKFAGVGGAIGLATAALPLVGDAVRDRPMAKAAVTGAAIGAAAGAVLPLMPIPLGAAIGAGVGLLIQHRKDHPVPTYPAYPGFQAYPGYVPAGMSGGYPTPNGLVPVTPSYGSYAGSAVNPYAYGSPYGASYGVPSYGYPTVNPYGYGASMLPMQATAQPATQQPVAAPVAARPAAAAPKFKGAKTFTDGAGNVRRVGTGAIVRPARGAAAAPQNVGVPTGMTAPTGAQAGLSQLTNPASYLPGMSTMLPFAGGSPFAAGTSALAGLGATTGSAAPAAAATAVPTTGVQPGALPARPIA